MTLQVNGAAVPGSLEKGYVRIDRSWKAGDVVELSLPMPIRRVVAHASVEADQGRVALQRGPLVYAAEWPDNPGGHVRNLLLADATPLTTEFRPELLGGVQVDQRTFALAAYNARGEVERREQHLTAIPYYAWANRGPGEMAVWIPNRPTSARPQPLPTLASRAKVTASHRGAQPARGERPERAPLVSRRHQLLLPLVAREGQHGVGRLRLRAADLGLRGRGLLAGRHGQRRVPVPASWRVLYKDGEEWKPVEAAGPYGVEKDAYNKVAFKPVTTTAMLAPMSSGIQEWKV